MKWGTPRERNHSSTRLTTSGSTGSTTHQCGGRDSSPCVVGSTPAARSPTWSPTTGRSSRCRARPPTRPGPSPPASPASPGRPELLAHGTTVATNALLQRRGAVVALVTNRGFADVIEIARQDRPSLYDQWADRPEPLVPRHLRLEVGGRLDATGTEIEPVGGLRPTSPTASRRSPSASSTPTSTRPTNGRWPTGCGPGASTSPARPTSPPSSGSTSAPSPPSSTPTCGPGAATTSASSTRLADEVLVMTSAGGLVPAAEAAELPVALLLSGPAGGVVAGAAAAAAAGFADAVTFDMGGTSTDVCLVQGGVPEPAPGRVAAGFPVRLPALDIHTIGAGGGSIASVDPGGRPGRRTGERGRRPRARLLRTGRAAADRHRRRPRPRPHPGRRRLRRPRPARRRRRPGRPRRGRRDRRRAWWRWSTRPWSGRCGRSPSSGASTRRAWPWWPSAGPAPSTPAPWPTPWAWPRWSSRPGRACCRRSACCARPANATWCARGRRPPTTPAWPRPPPPWPTRPRRPSAAARTPSVTTAFDCRYAGQSHELTVPSVDDFPAEHRRRNGYARPGRAGRGGGRPGPGPPPAAPRRDRPPPADHRPPPDRRPERSSSSPTARCGSPTAGRPTSPPTAAGCSAGETTC